MNELQKSIVRTIVYFDIFNYPLTLLEIYKWLYADDARRIRGYSLVEVEEALSKMADKIETKNGFYFLVGRGANVEKRLRRYRQAEDKFKRAIKFIKILKLIPFIKLIAVCNSLAYSNSGDSGDIDLFMIVKKNRLWLARFLAVCLLKILGVRPKADSKQDTLDANFFLSEDSLNIENLKIADNDVYLTYWVNQLVPIFDVGGTYQKFQQANAWVKKILPNSFSYKMNDRRKVGLDWFVKTKRFGLGLLLNYGFWEELSKKYQLKILPQDLKEMMNQDTSVVVNEHVLKFHRQDKRAEYFKKFNSLVEKL